MSTTTDTTTEQVAGSVEYIDPPRPWSLKIRPRSGRAGQGIPGQPSRARRDCPPIIAVRDTEGRTLVREGQCRTLGAREVGLSSVPVYVLPTGGPPTTTPPPPSGSCSR